MSGFILLLVLVVLIGALFFAVRSARSKKEMQSRLAAMVPGASAAAQPRRDISASIRRRERAASDYDSILRFLRVPQDLPLANVLAPSVVYGISVFAGLAVFWFAHKAISLPYALIVGIVVGVFLCRGIFTWEVERYRTQLLAQLPDTIQLVVSSTRAGLPISESFRAIAQEMPSPTRDEFIRVGNQMSLGATPDEALLAVHERTGLTEYAIFAVTIGVQSRSGGRLAETIQNLADTVRERLAVAARARALASESTMSAYIMGGLPIVCGAYMSVVQPEQTAMLYRDPRGIHLLIYGICSLTFGAFLMKYLINGVAKD